MKNQILIILQARSDSKRLPKKSLFLFKKIPLVVLCAKRLSNTGDQLIVATSNHSSDNRLCALLKENKIDYYRGSLKNVFSRFYNISKNLKKNDLIIRATADNPFPDGKLVKVLAKEIIRRKINYLGINHKVHKLPKGISLEIFKVKKLIETNNKKLTKDELEHVTLNMYKDNKKLNNILIKKLKYHRNLSNKRVTIDTIEDYNRISKIFNNIKNPYKISWKGLLKKL